MAADTQPAPSSSRGEGRGGGTPQLFWWSFFPPDLEDMLSVSVALDVVPLTASCKLHDMKSSLIVKGFSQFRGRLRSAS